MFRRALKSIRNNVLVGLILVTPIVVTAFVVNWLFTFITNRILVFVPKHLKNGDQEVLWRIAALIIVLVLLFLIGLLIRNILGKRLYQLGDTVLGRIPIVSRIYLGVRQVIEALFQQRETLFQEVVVVEYPRPGLYSIGFVTANVPDSYRPPFADAKPGAYVSVFIPTTPNPTSGWFIIVPREDTRVLPITSGEAMKLIVSGGAVFPGEKHQREPKALIDLMHDWMDKEDRAEKAPSGPTPPTGA